jgi:hypothetical protein
LCHIGSDERKTVAITVQGNCVQDLQVAYSDYLPKKSILGGQIGVAEFGQLVTEAQVTQISRFGGDRFDYTRQKGKIFLEIFCVRKTDGGGRMMHKQRHQPA